MDIIKLVTIVRIVISLLVFYGIWYFIKYYQLKISNSKNRSGEINQDFENFDEIKIDIQNPGMNECKKPFSKLIDNYINATKGMDTKKKEEYIKTMEGYGEQNFGLLYESLINGDSVGYYNYKLKQEEEEKKDKKEKFMPLDQGDINTVKEKILNYYSNKKPNITKKIIVFIGLSEDLASLAIDFNKRLETKFENLKDKYNSKEINEINDHIYKEINYVILNIVGWTYFKNLLFIFDSLDPLFDTNFFGIENGICTFITKIPIHDKNNKLDYKEQLENINCRITRGELYILYHKLEQYPDKFELVYFGEIKGKHIYSVIPK